MFPLPWMRALESASTGQPFMNGLDRFGLIPDPNNPDGLPVGLTATPSRDTRFLDLKMVGVNCAACHVNELKVGDKRVRIDGAPSLFDLGAFYGDLIESSLDTTKSPAKLFRFLRTLAQQPEKTTLTESAAPRARALIAGAFTDLESLRAAGEMEKGVADALDALIKAEHALPAVNLGAEMSTTKQGGTDFLSGRADGSKHWKGKKPGADSPLAKIASAEVLAARVLPRWLDEARVVIRLLRARGQFLQTLVQIQGGTSIGPGRIDAFGGARNLIFRPTPLDPSSAPVSYPHLWGFGDTVWLHWDANTTSVLERNIGQSLGLGAIFNPKTFESTVLPRNLHSLEVLADKLAAPAWPAEGLLDYKYVVVPHVFRHDTWVQAVQILPDNPKVLHHANLAYIKLGEKWRMNNFITGTVPGGEPLLLDKGVGFKVPRGAMLVMEVHYVTTGKKEKCRISVGLKYASGKIDRHLRFHLLADTRFAIPPGAPAHRVSASRVLAHDAIGVGLFCHMHVRGRDMTFKAHYPDGKSETLLLVPNYNFGWQMPYRWAPGTKKLPRGTRLEAIAHYDNSAFNPFNPDPKATVRDGRQTHHEMMNGFVFFVDANEKLGLDVDGKTGRASLPGKK